MIFDTCITKIPLESKTIFNIHKSVIRLLYQSWGFRQARAHPLVGRKSSAENEQFVLKIRNKSTITKYNILIFNNLYNGTPLALDFHNAGAFTAGVTA